jgi:hypothetical protein
MHNAKYEVEKVLQVLPDNCSLEHVQYSLYLLAREPVCLFKECQRLWKLRLIEKNNPCWNDLSETFF